MSDLIYEKAKELCKSINSQMDAHLFESIISLFNQGVLVHYARSPRTNIDTSNFKMTVDAANGVRFEGREKIIKQQQRIDALESRLKEAESVIDKVNSIAPPMYKYNEIEMQMVHECRSYKRKYKDNNDEWFKMRLMGKDILA